MPRVKKCIDVEHVSFSYGAEKVLDDVTFSLAFGEYAGIIGPNGSGKTTLVKIITGLLEPQHGTVRLFGEHVRSFSDRHAIGYVPQRLSQMDLKFPVTVEEVVRSGRTTQQLAFGHFQKSDMQAVNEALAVTDITALRKKLMSELSGGQRQRVFIARALAGESKLLILDEPSVGIDVGSQERFYQFLRHMHRTLHMTIVIVSHDVEVIAHEVETLLCLNKTLISHGNPKSVLTRKNFQELYGKDLKVVLHGH